MAFRIAHDSLEISCPDVHPDAVITIALQRTLRVPDDETSYGLPPSLGHFGVRPSESRVDADHAVALPMWQSEACWISFAGKYPFLVKVGTGTVNAVTGGEWSPAPDFDAEDYFETPEQPWLDGFNVGGGRVRQFVAMPLGDGYTAEEQLSDEAPQGGLHISVFPLAAQHYQDLPNPVGSTDMICFSAPAMGLGAGGSIRQVIATPTTQHDAWDLDNGVHVFVDIVNSLDWCERTGEEPASIPPTAADYARSGLPWFAWYDDLVVARESEDRLKGLTTVKQVGLSHDIEVLPENESFDPPIPVTFV